MTIQKWSKDVVAVVTGGNKGIGYEVVKGLAKADVTVVLTARDEGRGTAAVKALEKEGLSSIHFHKLDVDDASSAKELAAWLEKQFGGIDILINNAGIASYEFSPELALSTLATNFWGLQKVTDALLPVFKPKGLRRIVNVSSRLGQLQLIKSDALKAQLNNAQTLDEVEALAQKYLQDVKAGTQDEEWNTSPYKAYPESKVLLNAYTRVLARSLASEGFLINLTCPGFTATDLNNNSGTKTVEDGADTIIWVALLPVDGYPTGKFYGERSELEF